MSSTTVYAILLCLFYTSGNSISQDETDELELLKCKIDALEKSDNEKKQEIQKMEFEISSLKTRTQQQSYSLTEVRRQSSTLSTYCRLLPAKICGECTCLDDFERESKYYCDCQHLPSKRDCLEFYQLGYKINGIYKVNTGGMKPMQVFCDHYTDHGGWAVFQRRLNGEINFYRDWEMYKHGFGTLQREFWLGNDNVYVLTLQSAYPHGSELRIDMTDWNNTKIYAKYNIFQVGSESNNYTLHVEGYSGNAGDSFSGLNKQHFSTYDRDNDVWPGECSKTFRGAWWYSKCHSSNLNGEYRWFDEKQPGYARGVIWHSHYGYEYSLKHVEMKIRRKQ